ncbi:hypothetical protein SAMN06298212_1559 [Ruaniaceae bacterium KH17]|nr:hypothetical protein SAMN06298212_1559 [Ruaniaceae bacterium KH17]
MSLAPDSRTLLTDALQPPAGFRLDTAAATTYSLDLVALLLAPLSFAMHEHAESIETADPIAMLESVRRHVEDVTVFCQAAAIHPTPYRSALMFIEDSVVEVAAPREGALFHPKVWAIRFVSDDRDYRHRALILSRNLTFDTSWDTLLVLDEAPSDSESDVIDGAPLGRFVAELPGLALRPLDGDRAGKVADLAASIGAARFAVPEGYRSGEIVPLGMPWSEPLAIEPSNRLLAISPFLSSGIAKGLAAGTRDLTLLSRPTSLDGVPLADHAVAYVLDTAAESEDPGVSQAGDNSDYYTETNPPPQGLHAKTFIAERGWDVEVITGSANATSAAFERNVEMIVRLHGRKSKVGIDSVWQGSKESPGLEQITVPYTPQPVDPEAARRDDLSWQLDHWHASLSASDPVLEVGVVDGDSTSLTLHLANVTPPEGCVTRIRPLSLTNDAEARELAPELTWGPISTRNVTPFLAVTSTIGTGTGAVGRTSAIKAELRGDLPDRRRNALRDVLRNANDVLRYLVFLLSDPARGQDPGLKEALLGERWGAAGERGAWDRVNVFEPLVRAAAEGDSAVDRVEVLLAELGADEELIPAEFAALWHVIEALREEDRQ